MIIEHNPHYFDLTVTVNGTPQSAQIPTHIRLLDYLRDYLNLTGAKEICGAGECGGCMVLFDGQAVNSCLILAVEAEGAKITTIEGLGTESDPHPIQQAFVDEHAVQCGYCTPGFIISAEQSLRENAELPAHEIGAELAGNICRCTGYAKIRTAVERAGDRTR